MGIDNVIKMAMALVMAAAVTGHLPQATMAIRQAQVQLLEKSKASHWGSPDLLYQHKMK
jgi:hypothetical protein